MLLAAHPRGEGLQKALLPSHGVGMSRVGGRVRLDPPRGGGGAPGDVFEALGQGRGGTFVVRSDLGLGGAGGEKENGEEKFHGRVMGRWNVRRHGIRQKDRVKSRDIQGSGGGLHRRFDHRVLFLVHFFINIGMTIGITPITGLPLPFLSYGGSFVLSCFILQGLVQSVYRYRKDYT